MNPQFKHFCDQCKFLGPQKYRDREYDLYFCDKPGEVPVLFARYGNDATKCFSAGIHESEASVRAHAGADSYVLHTARRLARSAGFIKPL